ncbi:MAG: Ig-like domain-containing protein [Deltaproteobacteria bacterium]|nr:Ig-like domain-containing protein [Deltaproteobacteria bacterium]
MKTKKRAFPIKALLALLIIALSLTLTACFSDEEAETTTTTTTTTGGTTVGSVSVSAGSESISADGLAQTSIMATVKDTDNNNIADGTSVTFSTTLGTLSASSSTTTNGLALVTLTSSTATGTATITATAGGVSGEESVTFTSVPGYLSITADQTSVKSDNKDSATITASVLDSSYVPIEGSTVTFTTTGGTISASSVDTDANGEAEITFSSGTLEKKNQTVTITASVTGLTSKQIPIQVTGTKVAVSTDSTNLAIGESDTATLTITVKDASDTGIYDAAVTVSVDTASSTGTATLALATGYSAYTTDANGTLEVDVTGTGAGSVTVKVEALGATATQAYTVGTSGTVFGISAPTDDPHSLSTGTDLTVTVNAPTQTSVQFATTLGAWDGGADMVKNKAVAGGTVSATLRSANAGVANVQVTDVGNTSTTDTLTVAISAPSSEASQISLQASATVVAPSTGDVKNTVTLTATVKNATGEPVGGSAVAFSIQDPTGGGETVSPVIVYTDSYGKASSTFTSGSTSSDAQGVTLKATVIDKAIFDTIAIVIGGTAGSVTIGRGTTIESVNNNTAYQLPCSVLVSDSNGNPVANTTVSLSLWPTYYATGCWVVDPITEECGAGTCPWVGGPAYKFYINEDFNRNLILDANEDIGGNPCDGDGELTPPSSAAGSAPATVRTDDNGVANFNLTYLKTSAAWIETEITASTLVLGTETQSTYTLVLPRSADDSCEVMPNSPYNP